VPVHIVVTVEARKGQETPAISREAVIVREGHDRDEVIDWVLAQGEHRSLELMILLDAGSNTTLGTQLDGILNFINSQPDTTMVGVAYMRDGVAQVVQNLTTDHALAARALRLPVGLRGVNGSPYFFLTDLVKRWPATTARRAVVMATDGIDRHYATGDLQDPYLDEAIDNASREGITVSMIYTPGVGHFGHSHWQTYWGQIYLSRVAEETGGEGLLHRFHQATGFVHFVFGRRRKTAGAAMPTYVFRQTAEEGGLAANSTDDRSAERGSGRAGESMGEAVGERI